MLMQAMESYVEKRKESRTPTSNSLSGYCIYKQILVTDFSAYSCPAACCYPVLCIHTLLTWISRTVLSASIQGGDLKTAPPRRLYYLPIVYLPARMLSPRFLWGSLLHAACLPSSSVSFFPVHFQIRVFTAIGKN